MLGLGLGSQPTTECQVFSSTHSLALDGDGDYFTTGTELISQLNTESCSISFWVNMVENNGGTSQNIFKIFTDTDNQFQVIYHKYYTEWRASIKTDGTARIATYDIPGSSDDDGSGYADGWQHFAASFNVDGSTGAYKVKLYRNGTLVQNTSDTSGQNAWVGSINTVIIGSNQSGSGSFVDGHIDQFAFWSTELTSRAVGAIYNEGVMRDLTTLHQDYVFGPYLVGYYQFEDNALDSSKTAAHGTTSGNATFVRTQP
tara:strand:- start:617 stop:1387 length:771 start_codon:yes stop_codon:yes gene_type:complete